MSKKEIGQRIRELREMRHYSREYFAEITDISATFVYEIEIGQKGCSAATLGKIAKALKVSSDYILFGEEENHLHTDKIIAVLDSLDTTEKMKIYDFIVIILNLLN